MLGLFKKNYAQFEHNTLYCVSESEEKLVDSYQNMMESLPLLHGEYQKHAKETRTPHYAIEEIKCID